ncbi:MAG: hypothetical protein ACRD8O_08710 [Bryobacteraceae bacterium]
MKPLLIAGALTGGALLAAQIVVPPAQTVPPPAQPQVQTPSEPSPVYRVTVVSRTTKAINYGHRTEPARIDFKGTVLMPEAKGKATVESKRGAVQVSSKFEHVPPPTRFGPQYLTYVLWAITPEGRPLNMGELILDEDNEGKLKVTADLQSFAMIVTAEPYYSVTQPSGLVVMENSLRPGTRGRVEEVSARYELMPPTEHVYQVNPPTYYENGTKLPMDQYEAVLALYQARNAIQIAQSQGADQIARDSMDKAQQLYREAQMQQDHRKDPKKVVMMARQAAQAAEDARLVAAKRRVPPPAE